MDMDDFEGMEGVREGRAIPLSMYGMVPGVVAQDTASLMPF